MKKEAIRGVEDGKENEMALSYAGYISYGGLINAQEYQSALLRAGNGEAVSENTRRQLESMAKLSGIDLDLLTETIDPRALYGVLRHDTNLEEAAHHHSQMSDQKLFLETLRMLEAGDAVHMVLRAYPNIFH